MKRSKVEFVREGNYAAEVPVELIEGAHGSGGVIRNP
jgi:hypothetical protein